MVVDLSPYLDVLPHLSMAKTKRCDKQITSVEILDALVSCMRRKSLCFDGLLYELCINMPDSFSDPLKAAFCNCRQNWCSVTRGVMALIREDVNKRDMLDDFRFITLSKTGLKILVMVLANRLVRVKDLIREAQTCATPTMSILSKLHFIHYIIERFECKPGIRTIESI